MFATALHSGRLKAAKKPRDQTQANDEKKKRRTCHNIYFRPCIKIICIVARLGALISIR